jgi:hypothetical protein
MINHARTLLLNMPASMNRRTEPGYEYMEPNFKPIALPRALDAAHKIFFGANPDNYFANFRVRELLHYIHQTELESYLYRFDPRVTYWPERHKHFFDAAKKTVRISQRVGAPRRLNVTGTFAADSSAGVAKHTYGVTLAQVPGQTFDVTVQKNEGNVEPDVTNISNTNSPPIISLAQTDLRLRVNFDTRADYGRLLTELEDIFIVEDYTGETSALLLERVSPILDNDVAVATRIAEWDIELHANPPSVLTTALTAFEFFGEPMFLELFGLNDDEPYRTFKNLWSDHPLPAYRLSGIVLAVIYRLHELRSRKHA